MSELRFRAVAAALALCALVVILRASQIAIIQHDEWSRRARRQQQRTLEVPTLRATIRSAEGYVLAASVERVAIQVDTATLEYPDLFAAAAAPLLGVREEAVANRLARKNRAVWLAKQITKETAEQVRKLAPAAVVLVPDSERVYPLGSLASPVLGFVGREELRIIGRSGLEHHYDSVLAGKPDRYLAVRDAVQRQVQLRRLERGRTGYDLQLTIDARLQAQCERELEDAMLTTNSSAGSVVVLDPNSGDVLALVSLPSFFPSRPGEVDPRNWRLRPVQDAFEPGSTAKPLVAAAALSTGKVRPGERFDCTKRGVTIAGHWIRDHAEPGIYTLEEIIARSANVGIIAVGERVDDELLFRTFEGFGFGKKAGLGFPAEAAGILPTRDRWSRMTPSGLALGQEVTASPLQLALTYATIANGGVLLRPRLVHRGSIENAARRTAPETRTRVLDTAIATRLHSMLELVVKEGTGTLAQLPGYRVAGKTGTAQRTVAGQFDNEHHIAWFAGFLPLPEPRAVIVVELQDPVGDFWASSAAAPVFSRIAAAAASLLGIPPSEQPELQRVSSPTSASRQTQGET